VGKKKETGNTIKEQEVTYEAYAAMPDNGQRYEIFDGKLEMMSPGASATHQAISGTLMYTLMQSCKADYVVYHPPFDVILSEINVVQPDMMMVHRSRLGIVTERGIEGPPDLVVEIISPGSRKKDKVVKLRTYAKFGVQEYWVIDSDARTLEQYRLSGESYEATRYSRVKIESLRTCCLVYRSWRESFLRRYNSLFSGTLDPETNLKPPAGLCGLPGV